MNAPELFRIFIGGPISKVMLITAEYSEFSHGLQIRHQNADYIRSDLFTIGEAGPLVAIYAFADPISSIRQHIYFEAKELRSYIVIHGDCHVGLNAFLRVREPFEINAADMNRMAEGFIELACRLNAASLLQQRRFVKLQAALG